MSAEGTMPLLEHLEELRRRLFRMVLSVAVFLIPCYFLAQPLIEWIQRWACPAGAALYYLKPMALFFMRLKVGLVCATACAAPLIAYQAWQFIVPALRPKEARAVIRLAGASGLLFVLGACFALFAVFPALMRFAYGMGSDTIRPMLQVESVVEIAFMLVLGFGLVFQLPVVLFFCVAFGIVRVATLRHLRSYLVVGIFFLAALLTPPDVISQLCMALPAWLLFEASLLLFAPLERNAAASEEDGNLAQAGE